MLATTILAAGLAMEITWEAPAGCPPAAVVREEIEADRTPDHHGSDDLYVHAVVEERGPHDWVLTLEMAIGSDEPARRVVEGESCEAVTRAGILVVSLRLRESSTPSANIPSPPAASDQEQGKPTEPTPPAGAKANPVSPEPQRLASQPWVRRRNARPEVHGWLSAAGGAAYGVLPGWGGTVRLEGGVEGRHFRAAVGMQGLPSRTLSGGDPPFTARFDLVVATAAGCFVSRAGPVAFPLCGRMAVGGLRGQGEAPLPDPQTTWSPWLGLGAEVGVAWRVHPRVALLLAIEGLGAPLRPQFVTGNPPAPAWRPGAGGVRGHLGIEVHWPSKSRKRGAG